MYKYDPKNDELNLRELYRYLEKEASKRYESWGVKLECENFEEAECERQIYLVYKFWARAVWRKIKKEEILKNAMVPVF